MIFRECGEAALFAAFALSYRNAMNIATRNIEKVTVGDTPGVGLHDNHVWLRK